MDIRDDIRDKEPVQTIPLYVVITSMRSYRDALDALLDSLPTDLPRIIVYQGEPASSWTRDDDGNFRVFLPCNIYEYGFYVGVRLLQDAGQVPRTATCLLLHDTCKAGPEFAQRLRAAADMQCDNCADILWMSVAGTCNISLQRARALEVGYDKFCDVKTMSKMTAIDMEHFRHPDSPKFFAVKSIAVNEKPEKRGVRDVYNTSVNRNVIYFKSIDLEKYYVHVDNDDEHPQKP